MKTVTIEKTVYEFSELSDKAKQKALQDHCEHGMDHDWYDFVYEDAKEIANLMGIDIDKIYFSGFWSQGDGAMFEGGYGYKKNSVNAVKEYAPQDTELHDIAQTLANVQRKYFYRLSASVKHHGYYHHERSNIITIEYDDSYDYRNVDEKDEDAIAECLRDFMKWIYRQLEKEYEYLTSEEYFKELCEVNEYNFYENGKMANL